MIQDKLNAAWIEKVENEAVFEFRAAAQNLYNVMQETIARIDEITSRAVFAGVDVELKTEGQAVRSIINQSKAALDAHAAFLNWRQA